MKKWKTSHDLTSLGLLREKIAFSNNKLGEFAEKRGKRRKSPLDRWLEAGSSKKSTFDGEQNDDELEEIIIVNGDD